MSHRLGSLVAVSGRQFGPGVGTLIGPGTWEDAFDSPAPPSGTTKFMILHFVGVAMGGGDRLEVPLGNGDTDVFTALSGPDFWTRPIKGGSVAIRFVDGGTGAGTAPLVELGRGEGITGVGGPGENANGDIFMIDGAVYVDPPYFNPGGVCPAGARDWDNVATLPPGIKKDVAARTGIFLEVGGGQVSSCSAALIGPDLILTAGHCAAGTTEVPSGSFTLDYQTDEFGNRLAGYNPKFHKLRRLVRSGFEVSATGPGSVPGTPLDYAIIQIETPPGGLGVSPLSIRSDLPAIGEEVFLIHHPRGAAKKVSQISSDPECVVRSNGNSEISFGGDLDNGSSGSPLFDASGRIIGVNDWAGGCSNRAQAAQAILSHIGTTPPPPTDVDVILVFDRSGSMSLPGLSGATKIEEARAAAALFVDLLRTDRTHRAGLVTFSTNAGSVTGLGLISGNKDTLIGPPPARNAGTIGTIAPDAMTTIGGGLRTGRQQLTGSPGPNTPAILLLTDGLQNTPPMISDVEGELGDTRVCIVGFGTEGQLDGPLLTRLARDHRGIYTRAGEGLALKKFFVLSFGNIFQTGIAMDPFLAFPAGSVSMPPMPLNVCDEESITVVLSWQSRFESLILTLVTPAGNTLIRATPGIFASSGETWVYFRVQLPFNAEREGTWQVQVTRDAGGGEFPAPLPEERFFVTTTVDGGPYMKPMAPSRLHYTGDVLNPRVALRYTAGYKVDGSVHVEIERPTNGTGNLLTGTGLRPPIVVHGDQFDARSATLLLLEEEAGGPLIPVVNETVELFDDGERDGDGTLEEDGIYGNPLPDLLRQEGNYSFHARASYGDECVGTRETFWSTYVSVGIDPSNTIVVTTPIGTGPDGCVLIRTTVVPRDRYGNYLGPGRGDGFEVAGQPGSSLTGSVTDQGYGAYEFELCWDPDAPLPPGVIVSQPDRPAVSLPLPVPPGFERYVYAVKFVCGVQEDCDCRCAPVRPGVYATEINIHNYLDREVAIEKHVIPVVFVGAAAGREPRYAQRRASDKIVLPAHSATMDDCCRFTELLLGASSDAAMPITIGFLEVISRFPLSITAVYTVSDSRTGSVSMDVEQILGKRTR